MDPTGRKTPPDDDEWGDIWPAIKFASEAQPVLGPIVAIGKNWRAALAIIAFVIWINSPEVVAALKTLIGAGK